MGATLEIDWDSIRMLCISLGVRPAIRQMGIEGTSTAEAIRKRAQREGWLAGIPRNQPLPPTISQPVPDVSIDPAAALVAAWKDDMVQTRLGASRIARRQVAALERRDDASLLSDGGETVLKVVKTAALVHDWAGSGTQRVTVCLQAIDTGDLAIAPPDLSDEVIDV